jgi:hypothetical protein
MSFARLATVELQLIMQCCNLSSLLRMARCSRFTLMCADSEFSFQRMNETFVSSDYWTNVRRWSSARSLLRHVPLAYLDKEVRTYRGDIPDGVLKDLQSVFHLRSLFLPAYCIPDEQLQLLLAHPCCRRLKTLGLSLPAFAELMKNQPEGMKTNLAQLRSLHVEWSHEYFLDYP